MQYLAIFIMLFTGLVHANSKCSIANSMIPKCYHKRTQPILNVAIVYYGDFWNIEDLDRIEPLLIDRFHEATNQLLSLNVLSKKVLSYKHKAPADYRYNEITDPQRLQRLWYYDNVGMKIMREIYEEYLQNDRAEIIENLDALLIITGAQFDGLGWASGRVAITEQPKEIAWNLPSGGKTQIVSDYQVVDELLHELGHTIFLAHAAHQCHKKEMTYKERKECCAKSANGKDVMSYCRSRNSVNKKHFYKFEQCNLENIRDLILPELMSGGVWNVPNRKSCE
jgi:hypothetical protein